MKFQPTQIKVVTIHLLFWATYLALEYLANMAHARPGENFRFLRATLLSLPILITATYFIALYAVPKFLNKGKWGFFVLALAGVVIFVLYGRVKWLELVNFIEYDYFKVPVSKVLKNVIRDYSTIALAVCIYIIGDYRMAQQANAKLSRSKAEAEIKLLKGQLQPHFLFNSLNNIYSLALVKSDLTADSILKLTELLDYLVYRANKDKVALSKELQLLHNYIGLEQLRYGEQLIVDTEFKIDSDGLQVAPLLLLPFAENCFKHGGAGSDGLFRVAIQLWADEAKLVFNISNSKKNGKPFKSQPGGLGLQNIRQRLLLLYPGRHQLAIDDLPESYRVRLEIRFKHEKS